MNAPNKRLIAILMVAAFLLTIPAIAMRFTNEVNWTALDFITMGFMLLITGLCIEVALRVVRLTWMRVAAVAAILFAFVMVWGTLVHLGG
jgi:hypothetical protein